MVMCTTTWGELMYRLKAAAEGKKPEPLFSKNGMAYLALHLRGGRLARIYNPFKHRFKLRMG
jgi:hypothetical protein